jgi:hypothetical protein
MITASLQLWKGKNNYNIALNYSPGEVSSNHLPFIRCELWNQNPIWRIKKFRVRPTQVCCMNPKVWQFGTRSNGKGCLQFPKLSTICLLSLHMCLSCHSHACTYTHAPYPNMCTSYWRPETSG